MKLFIKKIALFVVTLIAIVNVVQFHHHDCLGNIHFLNFSEVSHHNHAPTHSHSHDCGETCPIIVGEAVNISNQSASVSIDYSDISWTICLWMSVSIEEVAQSVSKATWAVHVVPIKIPLLGEVNRYRGSPFLA